MFVKLWVCLRFFLGQDLLSFFKSMKCLHAPQPIIECQLYMVLLVLSASKFETCKRNPNVKTKMHFDHLETIFLSFFYVDMKFIASVFSKDTLQDSGLARAHARARAHTHTHTHTQRVLKPYRFWHLNLVKTSNISTLSDKEMMPGHLNHQHFLVLLKYLRKSGIGEIN